MLQKAFFVLYCFMPILISGVDIDASCISEETIYAASEDLCLADPSCFLPTFLSEELDGAIALVSMRSTVRSAVGYCTRCEDWVEIYYPSRWCPKCGKKILDAWPLGH